MHSGPQEHYQKTTRFGVSEWLLQKPPKGCNRTGCWYGMPSMFV